MTILVIATYALLAIYEFVPLYKQKLWKDFWINGVIGSFSFSAGLLLALGIKLPSPAMALQLIITSIFGK